MPYQIQPVLSNQPVAEGVWCMRVAAQDAVRPGQFYMLRPQHASVLLPRPISVCDTQDGVLTFLYLVVGVGTAEFSRMKAGDPIGLTGPLGNGFDLPGIQGDRIALVGGGVGIAPMHACAKTLAAQGRATDAFLGFGDLPYWEEPMRAHCRTVKISTDSGKVGHKGFVTDLLDPADYDAVLTCGPLPMMRAVTQKCIHTGTPVYISMENRMACGVGGCLVCTCTDKNGTNRRACAEGPVFRGEDINFEA